ncbi:MAG: DinB family protein [Phycisphaerales bacterium]
MQYSTHDTLAILRRTPRVLRALLADLGEDWTARPYGPDTWSAHDVLAHLIHGERTDWVPRARILLQHGDARAFDPFDRQGYLDEARAKPLAALLDEFDALRKQSLADLAALNLSPADLDRRGRHPALGPVTLRNLLATWACHDLNHVAQACKALAHQYRAEVGPWEAYMSILAPPAPR